MESGLALSVLLSTMSTRHHSGQNVQVQRILTTVMTRSVVDKSTDRQR